MDLRSTDDMTREAMQLLGQQGPAFLRRARRTEEAWQRVLARLAEKRHELLDIVGLRIATLVALAGDWERLARKLPHAPIDELRRIHAECDHLLRLPPEPTDSARALHGAWEELCSAALRFNHRWSDWVNHVDLRPVNVEREQYNRYYVLEKECAVGSSRIARQNFRPLPSVSTADLFAIFPMLPGLG